MMPHTAPNMGGFESLASKASSKEDEKQVSSGCLAFKAYKTIHDSLHVRSTTHTRGKKKNPSHAATVYRV
ncbi:MAG TPA: hypothetical protein VGO47_01645 [Chlamydiales bacterium]|nr:hypothetical protein [Chlamydiales bacterium]